MNPCAMLPDAQLAEQVLASITITKEERTFLLYDKSKSGPHGMILFPQDYRPGTDLGAKVKMALFNEMAKRSRPAFLKMLRSAATEEDGSRACFCGGKNCFR